ncbi:MAG: UbiH/UbiF/VisC/COQ6 family ubiquinone biosynthesis hydroxylase [Pseudomonadota bacterium]|nr:UbiH/UbiF/VisC/COQ6 family ubiquinone biosynthesis hydroxylase [Pseudomonadota bacterium]
MPDQQTDILIVGAGMVGSAAALSFARAGFSVSLVEANELPQWSASDYNLRVCAISAASERLLKDVGVWQQILDSRASPYEHMHVWDDNGSLDFDAADSGQAHLGYIVENNLINASLIERCQSQSNISLLTASRLSSMTWADDQLQIKLDNGIDISSRLVIAADGGNSQLRRLSGIESSHHDYQQTGIVGRVRTSLPHENTAWQRFLASGPLALLPLSDGSCSIVWSADRARAEELLLLNDADFAEQLAAAFEHRLGDVEVLSPRAGFPLVLANARTYIKDRVVLLGDAAHRVHPLAGQGVNLGFQDVAELSSTLLESVANGRDIADPLYLRRYARSRRAEVSLMLAGMDGIQRIFTSRRQLVQKSRRLAMKIINRLPPVKQFLVDRALGN